MRDWLSAAKPGPCKVVLERLAYSGTLQRCRWKSAAGGENKLSTGTCSSAKRPRDWFLVALHEPFHWQFATLDGGR